MRKQLIHIGLLGILWISPTWAQVHTVLEQSALVAAGAVTSILAHELGHQFGAWGTNSGMRWGWDGTWSTDKKDNVRLIVLSGWTTQALVAEALMASPLGKSNPFVVGYTNGYMVHMTQYMIRSALTSDGYRDFRRFSSEEKGVVSAFLAAHIALVAWRMYQPDGVPQFLQATINGVEWRW